MVLYFPFYHLKIGFRLTQLVLSCVEANIRLDTIAVVRTYYQCNAALLRILKVDIVIKVSTVRASMYSWCLLCCINIIGVIDDRIYVSGTEYEAVIGIVSITSVPSMIEYVSGTE